MTNLVRAFRALGDATRQRMLGLLESAGEMCVSDLAGNFEMTQPSISHHLRILKDAELVTAHKRGKEVYYAINPEELAKCCGMFFAKFACCRPLLKGMGRTALARSKGDV
jgi:ArsR family transcriptional regulator, arsenate/arsenite/antimonite-responsive transcriptional repressor